MLRTLAAFCFIILTQILTAQHLFPIYDGGKFGFIDYNGNVIIPPAFNNVGQFHEGLAPAREAGLYGYINRKGDWVITTQYEYAETFSNCIAVIYKNGKPLYIDNNNNIISESEFKDLRPFKNGFAIVTSPKQHEGLINKTGKLVLDTIYNQISFLSRGYFAAYQWKYVKAQERNTRQLKSVLVDSLGSVFYSTPPNERLIDFTKQFVLILAQTDAGKLILKRISYAGLTLSEHNLPSDIGISGMLSNGLMLVSLNKSHCGFMDINGNIQIDNPDFRRARDFYCNRSFVQITEAGPHRMINTRGEFVGSSTYDKVGDFVNNRCVVRLSKREHLHAIIDTNGNVIKSFTANFTQPLDDSHFSFYVHQGNNNSTGVMDYNGNIIIHPARMELDPDGFNHGMLRTYIDQKLTYIDTTGNITWQESVSSVVRALDIDYMKRSYFVAYSSPIPTYSTTRNYATRIEKNSNFTNQGLSVKVSQPPVDTFGTAISGFHVDVVNSSNDTFYFNSSDHCLSMLVQAENKEGEWTNIEYLPTSWCGNSYNTLHLKPGELWQFTTPCYKGSLNTKLRIALEYVNPEDVTKSRFNRRIITLYSNEYDGSVNPAQFWRKQEYTPNGLMDPYND